MHIVKLIANLFTKCYIGIMDIQNVLFNDFDINNKVSIVELKNILIDTFQFESDEATQLARFLIEIPDQIQTEQDEENDIEYKFDPDRQLSQAKVIARLQSIMNVILSDE